MSKATLPKQPERVGPYRLDAWLGAGGMGTVWRAWDERLQRPVAIKNILPAALDDQVVRARFRREARATARLNHPAIVHVYDIIETDSGEWIVMELVEGENLNRLIHDSAPLPIEQLLSLAQSIARGLAEAHAKGIVHRDLKADNVMVTPQGEAKILDFGLAKPLSPDMLDTDLTADGQLVGTAQAMSPEQVMGGMVDPRSDLFSLGTLLFEMLTGDSPFKGQTLFATMDRICRHEPSTVAELRPEVPHKLSELVGRLLSKEPAGRPRNAREVVATLMQLADRPPAPAPGSPPAAVPATAGARADLRIEPTSVSRPQRQVAASPPDPGFQPGERRQVTVICCDLLGEGADEWQSEKEDHSFSALDPEALYELMPEFQALAEQTLERFEGCVGNVLGHRLWAYFGYPQAQEDSAQRAVRAALELGEQLHRLEGSDGSTQKLALRTAIHTGPAVVMGSPAGQLALGPTLELAMGLHGLAMPGQVWISRDTHRLIAGQVTWEALSPVRLTGFEKPVPVFRVLSVHAFKSVGGSGSEKLIARDTELDELMDLWRRVGAGTGQVVLVSGEPGIGKSRIVRALEERLSAEAPPWWLAYGTPYTSHSPLHPMAELLRRLLSFEGEEETTDADRARLEDSLGRHGFSLAEYVPLFASLLALPLGEKYSPSSTSPEKQRAQLLEAMIAFVLERAEREPAVLVVEDLQWLDPSTLELLDHLIHQIPTVPLLAVLTFRTGFEPPWETSPGVVRMELEALDARQAARLVDEVAAGHDLLPAVRRRIVAQTDGVPLFVEELTKTVLESEIMDLDKADSDESRPSLTIPATLKDSLTARLDRLGPTKVLAQEAAVIGREFFYEVLVAVSSAGEGRVRRGLSRLVDSGLVQPLSGWRLRYLFQHALVRDAAYESLLSKRRRELHQRVAQVLESHAPSRVTTQPELLAHHFTEARVADKAAKCWLEAGRLAIERSAVREGIVHLERGLAALRTMPAGAERDQLELALLSRLGPAASVAYGYGAPEVEKIYAQANELCERFGTAPQVFWILWGLWAFHLVRSDLGRALELGRQISEIAEKTPRSRSGEVDDGRIFRLVAWSAVALAHYFRGELRDARGHLEKAEALDPPGRTAPLHSATGQDTGVLVRALLALVLWHLGRPRQAVEKSAEAIALAERISHPYSLAFAQVWAARLHQSNRDPARSREAAEAAIVLAEQNGFFWLSQGYFFRGCSLAESRRQQGGEVRRPVAVDRAAHFQQRGLDDYRAGGARLSQTYMLAQMAESCIGSDRLDEARDRLDEAFAACKDDGERFWEAELWRLSGELVLADGSDADSTEAAGNAFAEALAIARRRGDRAFELRAALALGRLWQSQDRHDEARALLDPICGAFEERIMTADLDEARSLLAVEA